MVLTIKLDKEMTQRLCVVQGYLGQSKAAETIRFLISDKYQQIMPKSEVKP